MDAQPASENSELGTRNSELLVPDLAATLELGRRLGRSLFPGAVVALIGPLGAGKTHFTRGVAEGLGIRNSDIVNSPTFVLIQEYRAGLPIYHFDAYRLRSAAEFDDLGAHEYFDGDGVCLIEWADRVEASLPAERLTITIEPTGETSRRFVVRWAGEEYAKSVEGWLETRMEEDDHEHGDAGNA